MFGFFGKKKEKPLTIDMGIVVAVMFGIKLGISEKQANKEWSKIFGKKGEGFIRKCLEEPISSIFDEIGDCWEYVPAYQENGYFHLPIKNGYNDFDEYIEYTVQGELCQVMFPIVLIHSDIMHRLVSSKCFTIIHHEDITDNYWEAYKSNLLFWAKNNTPKDVFWESFSPSDLVDPESFNIDSDVLRYSIHSCGEFLERMNQEGCCRECGEQLISRDDMLSRALKFHKEYKEDVAEPSK